jgi:hypothetical protein
LILFNYREQLFKRDTSTFAFLAESFGGLRLLIKCPHLSVVSFVKDRGYAPGNNQGSIAS